MQLPVLTEICSDVYLPTTLRVEKRIHSTACVLIIRKLLAQPLKIGRPFTNPFQRIHKTEFSILDTHHNHPLISIIIVNWNVGELVVQALQSLYEHGGYTKEEMEVLVVDNASSDDSVTLMQAAFPNLNIVVLEENVGFGRANNKMYAQCRADLVLLLNPDTIVQNNAVKKMVEQMLADTSIGALGCRLLNPDGSFQRSGGGAFPTLKNLAWNYFFLNRFAPKSWAPPAIFFDEDPGKVCDVEWISGAALLLRKTAVGDELFNVKFFMYGEDIELCHRIAQRGWRIVYTPEASIVHLYGQSIKRQDSAYVLAAPLKGPRAFFIMLHGKSGIWFYDFILFAGYAIRWPLFCIAAALQNNDKYRDMSKMSRKFALTAGKFLLRITK